ncbi:DUF971 domain-containing protein [Thalassoglobus sp. JC818]|uniref:DUF971 domain-containing protein n=1 Tax=Thalassoglobus sp. JC818 TaxID=3232136 RepID=UPI00345758D8
MATAPQNIRAIRDDGVLELVWNEGRTDRYPFHFLRCQCPCAACVNEFTGERILNPETVPKDIHPVEIGLSGNYALKIRWSDEHFTGLYSWDYLDQLSGYSAVTSSTEAKT